MYKFNIANTRIHICIIVGNIIVARNNVNLICELVIIIVFIGIIYIETSHVIIISKYLIGVSIIYTSICLHEKNIKDALMVYEYSIILYSDPYILCFIIKISNAC